jgi:hemolysin activation/secretion protein
MRLSRLRWRPLGFASVLVLAPFAAEAQTVVNPGAGNVPPSIQPTEELNPAARTPQAQPRRREDDLFAPPPPGACPIGAADLKFTLKSVEFTGAQGINPRELDGVYRSRVGQTISLADVCDIRDSAAARLFRLGILARVEIPVQTISDGHLKLEITAAHVVSVEVKGDAGPAQAKVEDLIENLRGMTPFDIRKAQRYLFLVSDLPGIRIQAALKPAAGGPGSVDLIVTVSRKPVDGVVNIENYNSEALGSFGGLVRVDLNGFTALGERTTLIGYSSFVGGDQYVLQGVEEARLGNSGLIGRVSFSYGDSQPEGNLAPLRLEGQSYVGSVGLTYPLIRSRREDVNLSAGLDYINQLTTVNDGLNVLSRDKLSVFFVKVDARQAWRQTWLFPPGQISGGIEFRQGVDILGASHAGTANLLSRTDGEPQSSLVRADGRLDLQWLPWLSTRTAFSGQFTDRVLLAYEDFTVGNLSIGRGYDPSSLTGDRGIAGSQEIRVGPFHAFPGQPKIALPQDVNVSGFGFFDTAHVQNLSTGSEDRTVRSLGGGLTFQFASRLRLETSYAHTLDTVSANLSKRPGDRVFVNFTASF